MRAFRWKIRSYLFRRSENTGFRLSFICTPVGGHGLSTCDMLSANAEGYGVQEECQSWLMLAKKWLEEV